MRTYNQLTKEQRYHIQALLQAGNSQREIANEIGVHKSTISREIKRNIQPNNLYRAMHANIQARKRRFKAKKAIKMTPELITLIESLIRKDWSPEQISGWLKLNTTFTISHERIYQHIHEDKKHRGNLFWHLRHRNKRYCRRGKGHARNRIKNRRFITERPEVVDEKSRYGDWETDTIVGLANKSAIVTVVERKSQFMLMKHLKAKNSKELKESLTYLLKPLKSICHTITNDNGAEFAMHEEIAKELKADIYFANPYSPGQRGLNEQVNGLVRQYLPKKTDFNKICYSKVHEIMRKINHRPRKSLGYLSPYQVLQAETSVKLNKLMGVALQG